MTFEGKNTVLVSKNMLLVLTGMMQLDIRFPPASFQIQICSLGKRKICAPTGNSTILPPTGSNLPSASRESAQS